MPEYYTSREVRKMFMRRTDASGKPRPLHTETLKRWRKSGFPHIKVNSRVYLYPVQPVDELMKVASGGANVITLAGLLRLKGAQPLCAEMAKRGFDPQKVIAAMRKREELAARQREILEDLEQHEEPFNQVTPFLGSL